ncbi:hypothetical protein QVD99_008037 [Batrachochytrium dendrobatidis]|nr:hypothetical protein O5D80_004809 [Batrachochytrium dendrobatidis]KAK5665191.1 hypothetical protein QVD99_008037 [Batrachochytrium dendrobatidis]
MPNFVTLPSDQTTVLPPESHSNLPSMSSTAPRSSMPSDIISGGSLIIRPATNYAHLTASNSFTQTYTTSDTPPDLIRPTRPSNTQLITDPVSVPAVLQQPSASHYTDSVDTSRSASTILQDQIHSTPASSSGVNASTQAAPTMTVPSHGASTVSSTSPRVTMSTISSTGMHHHFMSPWDMQFAGSGSGYNYFATRSTRTTPGQQPNAVSGTSMPSTGSTTTRQPSRRTVEPTSSQSQTRTEAEQYQLRMHLQAYASGNPTAATTAALFNLRNSGSAYMDAHTTQSMRPHFRSKVVCILNCLHCSSQVCKRGMKAILLADTNIELFSTDAPPFGVQLVYDDYLTRNCQCRIRDVACLGCGNVIGYHVTQPCGPCMDACNNGHFWMFHVTEVNSHERPSGQGSMSLVWSQIPKADKDQVQLSPYLTVIAR